MPVGALATVGHAVQVLFYGSNEEKEAVAYLFIFGVAVGLVIGVWATQLVTSQLSSPAQPPPVHVHVDLGAAAAPVGTEAGGAPG